MGDRPLDVLDADARETLPDQSPPEWLDPMLATLTDDRFSDPDWIFERKLDGERILVFHDGDDVRLRTRNQKDANAPYPELVEAVAAHTFPDVVLDGEIVAFEGNRTSFARLQPRMQQTDPQAARDSGVAVYCYLFDILHADGCDLRDLPLRQRKRVLRAAVDATDPLRLTAHRNADGEAYWRSACERGWEGVIAKRADAPYRGSRSRDWLKFKCVHEQELVIGGFTDPQGERTDFGALLVGYHADDAFVYAGKVGTGYDRATLADLGSKLRDRERDTSPFDRGDLPSSGVHWVTPDLVAQVGFTEWTQDGRLRHPRYLGLRDDKDPDEVVREQPS